MKTIQYTGVVSPWYDTLGGSGLTWTTGMQAELKNDIADELLGYVTLFSFISESGGSGGSVTLPSMQTAFDAGTAPQKAAFQSSVSGAQITTSAAISDTGPHPHLTPARISDGDEIGTPVVWWSPTGSGGFWGYAISPTDKFGV